MLLTAFILGLAGSLHCAGMCSPLAFAVTGMKKSALWNRVWYNGGRILVYGFLGLLISALGVVLPLENFQNGLSVGMGIIFVLIGIIGTAWVKIPHQKNPMVHVSNFLKSKFAVFLQRRSTISYFFMGALNGILPCGLTLIALTSCLILPTAFDGFYFMLLFGLGTLPVMLGFSSIFKWLIETFHFNVVRANAFMLILAGGLLIGRTYFFHSHPSVNLKQSSVEVICR